MRMSADTDTLQMVRDVLAAAALRGLDAAEALDVGGLLWHPAREQQCKVRTVLDVAEALDQTTVMQMAANLHERPPTSFDETKRIIVAHMRSQVKP